MGTTTFVHSSLSWIRMKPAFALRSVSLSPRRHVVPVRCCTEISKQEVQNIAKLAQLRLSEEEVNKVVPEIKKIIKFFDTFNEVDVEGVEPMDNVQDMYNVMREDKPSRFDNVDGMMQEVPCSEREYVRVPRLSSNPTD